MSKKLAFVLAGGGSRGALQVGALRALWEAGLQPDLLVGVSIGAVNSAYVAAHGFSEATLDDLVEVWHEASRADLLPFNYVWLAARAVFGRSPIDPSRRIKDFFIAKGMTEELRFCDLRGPQLIVVSADLNRGEILLHGADLDDKVLDGLLLSTALPPWVMPVRRQGRYLVDGGLISNLPVEAALRVGATHIVALDLFDPRDALQNEGVTGFFGRMSSAVEHRTTELELELAEARGVPLLYINLTGETPTPYWDFHHTEAWMALGYETARTVIETQEPAMLLALGR